MNRLATLLDLPHLFLLRSIDHGYWMRAGYALRDAPGEALRFQHYIPEQNPARPWYEDYWLSLN